MCGNDPEGTLNTGLHEEGAKQEHHRGMTERPGVDRQERDGERQHDGVASPQLLRELPEEQSASDRPNVVENWNPVEERHVEDGSPGEPGHGPEEVRVEILRAVREAEHHGHKDHEVDEEADVLKGKKQNGLYRCRLVKLPGGGLRRGYGEGYDDQCDPESNQEERPPTERWNKGLHGNCYEQISERVPTLH